MSKQHLAACQEPTFYTPEPPNLKEIPVERRKRFAIYLIKSALQLKCVMYTGVRHFINGLTLKAELSGMRAATYAIQQKLEQVSKIK